jgi:putative transcriptional regulator
MQVDGVAGKLLVASPLLREPTFARTVIAILEHNSDGALGVVINRPAEAPLADVLPPVADIASSPAVLFSGGPVSPEAAIALGMTQIGVPPRDPTSDAWRPVTSTLVSVDLDYDPAVLGSELRALRVFVGYAGWSAGQLEGEIAQGAWYVVEALPGDAFEPSPQRLWSMVLRRQQWPLSAVATFPADPSLN